MLFCVDAGTEKAPAQEGPKGLTTLVAGEGQEVCFPYVNSCIAMIIVRAQLWTFGCAHIAQLEQDSPTGAFEAGGLKAHISRRMTVLRAAMGMMSWAETERVIAAWCDDQTTDNAVYDWLEPNVPRWLALRVTEGNAFNLYAFPPQAPRTPGRIKIRNCRSFKAEFGTAWEAAFDLAGPKVDVKF